MMQKLKLTKVAMAAGAVSLLSLLSALSAHAIEYGGFGGKPAYPRADNPRTESIIIHTLQPGATQAEGVLVVNNSPSRVTLMVYAADSTPSSGGAFACEQLVEEKTDVGAWISLSKSEVTLDPATNETVPFTISVPASASLGEHNGCILIQEKKDPVPGQTGAVVSVRTGIRVAITIPGDIMRKLEIVGFSVSESDTTDNYLLHPLVKNTGNVSIDADVAVLTRSFTGLEYAAHGGQYPILRGETSEWNFELKRPFWGGWFRSSFTVQYDEDREAVIGVNSGGKLTKLPDTGSGATGGGEPAIWFFVVPSPLALAIEMAIFLLVVCGILFFAFRAGTRKRRAEKN